jgi:hypothetical protein
MRQILHIFRKDVRHHWPEIVISLAALVAYAWRVIRSWGPQTIDSIGGVAGAWASGLILVLLPLSWWFLILRLVQNESLVGDRQFWITRPYEWKKLLAEKVLFVLVFINVPLLLAGIFLLARAGFSLAPHWLGLLWMQLLLILMPLLPIMTLAAVTRNLAQGLLAMLAVLLYTIGMAALSTVVESGRLSTDAGDWLLGAVLIIASVTAIWLQYAWRRTARARTALGMGAALILVISLVTPLFVNGEREYPPPAPGAQPPFHASLWPFPSPPKNENELEKNQPVRIQIPIQTWGLPEGSFAQVRAVMLAIDAPDGFRWNSGWQAVYKVLFPEPGIWRQDFQVDRKTFEQLKSIGVKTRVVVAATVFRDQNARQMAAARGEFLVPDVGRCRLDWPWSYGIRCVSPLVRPSRLLVSTDLAASTCPLPEQREEEGKQENATPTKGTAYAWETNGDQGPADYGVSPVQSFRLWFWNRDERIKATPRICPGTPLRISFPTLVERTRIDFEASGVKLSDYQQENFAFGNGVFGVDLR